MEREVYVKPPKQAMVPSNMCWKMEKSAYGLYDAGRQWYLKVCEKLVSFGCTATVGDEALFYYLKDGNLMGVVSVHVDDFNAAGNDEFKKNIMDKLYKTFDCSKREF